MVTHRRARVPGAAYFFTVTLRDRRKIYLFDLIDLLRSVVRAVLRERPFAIEAAVIVPDPLHVICTLSAGDADYSGRWRAIKARFRKDPGLRCAPSRLRLLGTDPLHWVEDIG